MDRIYELISDVDRNIYHNGNMDISKNILLKLGFIYEDCDPVFYDYEVLRYDFTDDIVICYGIDSGLFDLCDLGISGIGYLDAFESYPISDLNQLLRYLHNCEQYINGAIITYKSENFDNFRPIIASLVRRYYKQDMQFNRAFHNLFISIYNEMKGECITNEEYINSFGGDDTKKIVSGFIGDDAIYERVPTSSKSFYEYLIYILEGLSNDND